ncbi:uncharacterized protein (DUF305 family) [Rhodoligotrophos appendicifer]|uniref:CopM family metallochaperone n=1 Tax=Rhodoligotrophos appendicifer TaxID=987056 RepID=UPI001184E268|nr:DUF305 domain-containing protein [Rhodoligotrophos appendicifer]
MRTGFIAVLIVTAGLISPAAAQTDTTHQHGTTAGSEAEQAFREAMTKMHQDMDIKPSGTVDVDFVRGMIAHHQGAIDMARVELQYGTDPELKALAAAIITAQRAEIDWMKAWLKKNGG